MNTSWTLFRSTILSNFIQPKVYKDKRLFCSTSGDKGGLRPTRHYLRKQTGIYKPLLTFNLADRVVVSFRIEILGKWFMSFYIIYMYINTYNFASNLLGRFYV